jgi:hypothetical protein
MDHCVSDARMAQAQQAKDLVLKEIPAERIIEVILNDGCNDSEEPGTVVFLKGTSNPLGQLEQESGWQPVPAEYLTLEKASKGVTRPFGEGYLVAMWRTMAQFDPESNELNESRLGIGIEWVSPLATASP